MHSVLAFQVSVGILSTLNLHGHTLYSGLVAVLKVTYRHLMAVSLGPALIHAHQHRRPVLALGAAGTAVYLQHHVHRIFFLAEHVFQLETLYRRHGPGVVVVHFLLGDHLFLVEIESELQLIGTRAHFGISVYPPFYALHFLHLLLGTLRVFPEVGRLRAQVFLLKFYLFPVYVEIAAQGVGTLDNIFQLIRSYHFPIYVLWTIISKPPVYSYILSISFL